jgi:hypothetical protein
MFIRTCFIGHMAHWQWKSQIGILDLHFYKTKLYGNPLSNMYFCFVILVIHSEMFVSISWVHTLCQVLIIVFTKGEHLLTFKLLYTNRPQKIIFCNLPLYFAAQWQWPKLSSCLLLPTSHHNYVWSIDCRRSLDTLKTEELCFLGYNGMQFIGSQLIFLRNMLHPSSGLKNRPGKIPT